MSIVLNEKQCELYNAVIGVFGEKLREEEIANCVKMKIKHMSVLDYISVDAVNIKAEFNDLVYQPQKRFKVPPVSYFDTKQGYWESEKNLLIKRFGNMGRTIDGVLGTGMLDKINAGASFFDPMLCELIIGWFNTFKGRVLNPFCGEASIGLISGAMGCKFVGVDIRQEQVDMNNRFVFGKNVKPTPKFLCGNSLHLGHILCENKEGEFFDLVFSSPPYYDLEVYSKNKGDLSHKQSYAEFLVDYKKIFAQAVGRLNDNRFLVVKVSEIRDENGIYRNFVAHNQRIFKDLGLHYYNEIILLNQFGSAPMRFNINFKSRKMVRLHQNILVFFKGDVKMIPEIYQQENKIEAASVAFRKDLWKE